MITVKELIEMLQKCSPDAIVCVEAYNNCIANVVKEYYMPDGKTYVYVADETDYIDEDMEEETLKV